MTRSPLVAVLLLVAACSTDSPSVGMSAGDGPVLPDTQTVDGVLVMRHAADAFTRAPQWRVADSAEVVFDGGEDPDLDLSHVYRPTLFPDGSLIATNSLRSGRVMHFPADGQPARMVAGRGEGPGDVIRPTDPISFGDSVAVVDDVTGRVNWFTAAGGWVGSETLWPGVSATCLAVGGVLPDRRLVGSNRCLGGNSKVPPDGGRLPTELITAKVDFTSNDTIAILPGHDIVWFETRYRGDRRDYPMMRRLAGGAHAAVWGGSIASSTERTGYVVAQRTPDGTIRGRLEVPVARRPVTAAMREYIIAQELERLDGGGGEQVADGDEARRQAREVPFADSLPAFSALVTGAGGLLWVVDARAPNDTTWAATAFREDGEIIARLSGSGSTWPAMFLDDQVLIRTTDDDGVVRFEVRRIVRGER